MKTVSLLVRFPGYPFAPETLLPDHRLASIAGSLLDAGHETSIQDFATVGTFARLSEYSRASATGATTGRACQGAFSAESASHSLPAHHAQLCGDLALRLCRCMKHVQLVVFMLESFESIPGTLAIAQGMKAKNPDLVSVGAGPYAESGGEQLLRASDALDGLFLGEAESGVVALADSLDNPLLWQHVPNLMYRFSGAVLRSVRRNSSSLSTLPSPVYDSSIYPALRGAEKIHLFVVEDSRGQRPANGEALRVDAAGGTLRQKPVARILAEMDSVHNLHGTRAFHFSGGGSRSNHLRALARAMLERGTEYLYSRTAQIHQVDPGLITMLRLSGCCAVGYPVYSGSQRLLEQHHHSGFGVTQAEEVLRASRAGGLFTVAQLRFPCLRDDFHTRAETLRLLERTLPDAAWVGADEEGFPESTRSFAARWRRDLESAGTAPRTWSDYLPFGGHRGMLQPRRGGTSLAEIRTVREHLCQEIELRGIATAVSEVQALMSALYGYAGREQEFSQAHQAILDSGDAAALGALVEVLNGRASRSAGGIPMRPFGDIQTAVGN